MRRTVRLNNGNELQLECNAASPIIFKRHWNEDLMNGFQNLESKDPSETITFMEKAVYTFSKTAEFGVKAALNIEVDINGIEFIEFLSQFDFLEIASGEVLNTVMEMWGINIRSEAELKNLQSPQQENPQ